MVSPLTLNAGRYSAPFVLRSFVASSNSLSCILAAFKCNADISNSGSRTPSMLLLSSLCDIDGETETICAQMHWSREVRRLLYTSPRFALLLQPGGFELKTINRELLTWYYYRPKGTPIPDKQELRHPRPLPQALFNITITTFADDDAHNELKDEEEYQREEQAVAFNNQDLQQWIASPSPSNNTQLTSNNSFSSLDTKLLLQFRAKK